MAGPKYFLGYLDDQPNQTKAPLGALYDGFGFNFFDPKSNNIELPKYSQNTFGN